MVQKRSFLQMSYDKFLDNLPSLKRIINEHLTIITVLVTIVGSLQQVVVLINYSPSLLNYYSPTQGILDGILFLAFIGFIYFLYSLIFIAYIWAMFKTSPGYRIFFVVTVGLSYGALMMGLTENIYFPLSLLLIIPLAFLIFILPGENDATKITGSVSNIKNKQDKISEKYEELALRRFSYSSILIFLIIGFFIFIFQSYQFRMSNINALYNNDLVEKKVNALHSANFVVFYTNRDYIFLKDEKTNKFLVINNSTTANEILPLKVAN